MHFVSTKNRKLFSISLKPHEQKRKFILDMKVHIKSKLFILGVLKFKIYQKNFIE